MERDHVQSAYEALIEQEVKLRPGYEEYLRVQRALRAMYPLVNGNPAPVETEAPKRRRGRPTKTDQSLHDAVLVYLHRNGPSRPGDVHRSLEAYAYSSVHNKLLAMLKTSEVERVRRGVYAIKER